jgi:hypothetical protein
MPGFLCQMVLLPPNRAYHREVLLQSDKLLTRRYNSDGKIEAICMKCFRTVCRCRTEEEAGKEEANHACTGVMQS